MDSGPWIGIAGVAVAFLTLAFNRLDRRRTAQKEAEAAAKAALNGMEGRIMSAASAKVEELRGQMTRTFSERDQRLKEERDDTRASRRELYEAVQELNRKFDALLQSLAGVRIHDSPRR